MINRKMQRLVEELDDVIQIFFDEKTENADIPERAMDAIQERIELLQDDIKNLVEIANEDIDDVVQEFTPEELENIKSDLRYERMCG